MLSRIVEWYNFLRTGTEECEYNIISAQIDKIDTDLDDAIKISTWLNYSKSLCSHHLHITTKIYKNVNTGPGYLKYVYDNIHTIYENITTAQANVRNCLKSISEWSSAPMYKRKDDNRNSCLDISNAENHMKMQNEKIDITKELIQRSMHENFNLFFNVDSTVDESNNCKLTKCNHKFIQTRMDIMRSIGKSSEDLRHISKVK